MLDEHKPQGLAAIARLAKDAEITVTSLRAAIAQGKLATTQDANGRAQVTLSDARLLLAKPRPATSSEIAPKATPRIQKRTGVKLPRRRG